MDPPSRSIHVLCRFRAVEREQLKRESFRVLRLNSGLASGAEKPFDSRVPKTLDHAYTVTPHASLCPFRSQPLPLLRPAVAHSSLSLSLPHPVRSSSLPSRTLQKEMSPGIQFRDVSFRTPARSSFPARLLLDSISLTVEESSTTAILGRSRSGKTTLLRTVNRLLEPTSGEVLTAGRNVRDIDLITLRRGIGYVIQETGLFPHFSIERNVGVVLEAEGRARAERVRRSHELLLAVGLDP